MRHADTCACVCVRARRLRVLTVLLPLVRTGRSLAVRQQAGHGEELPAAVLAGLEGASRRAKVKLLGLHLREAALQPLGRREG